MATDSSELTFIRCPSCRSLVPAMSSKCRMCGAPLESGAAADPGSQQKSAAKSGRVRQRTTSASREDVESALKPYMAESQDSGTLVSGAGVSGERALVEEDAPVETFDAPETFPQEEDSFGAFFNEPSEAGEAQAQQEARSFAQDEEPLADPLGFFADEQQEQQGTSAKDAHTAKKNGTQELADFGEDEDDFMQARPQAPRKPPVAVGRQATPPSAGASAELRESPPQRAAQAGPPRITSSQKTEARAFESLVDEEFEEEVHEEEIVPASPAPPASRSRGTASRISPAVRSTPAPQVSDAVQEGELCGWLVNFDDPKGVAIELRSGKCFVTRQSLKSRDIILDDESISLPHALLNVRSSHNLFIQDLMSEHGVHVKKSGSEKYQAVLDTIELQHGDWVKLGKLEFLVSLLPEG